MRMSGEKTALNSRIWLANRWKNQNKGLWSLLSCTVHDITPNRWNVITGNRAVIEKWSARFDYIEDIFTKLSMTMALLICLKRDH